MLDFRFFGTLLGALGVADPKPLRRRLGAVVDDAMLAEIARDHGRGRRLLVVTTNIAAARPVLWDMGAIAEAGARQLFLDVLLASASIPGAFPPVPIVVEANGERFVELHVDGGVTRSVAIGPTGLAEVLDVTAPFPRLAARAAGRRRLRRAERGGSVAMNSRGAHFRRHPRCAGSRPRPFWGRRGPPREA